MDSISIIHTCTPQHRNQLVQLWQECLPGTPEGRLEWMASGNPAGPAEWFLAYDDMERLVAVTSLTPKILFYNGRRIKGGIVGDIMVASDCRGKGLAKKIQKMIASSLQVLGMDFLYVVPNKLSNGLFLHSESWQNLRLKVYLIPIDAEHYLKKIGLHFAAKWIGRYWEYLSDRLFRVHDCYDHCTMSVETDFCEETDALWESVIDVPDLLVGSKSVADLNWKYHSGENEDLCILKYRLPSGLLVGYCVFHKKDAKIYIYELVSSKEEYYMGLISMLRSLAKGEHCVGIYFYTTSGNPILKTIWWRGLFPIGGDLNMFCMGEIFENKPLWLFFAGDRNV